MRTVRPALTALSIAAALALTATACGADDSGGKEEQAQSSDENLLDRITIPEELDRRLKEHGIDLDKWRDGAWRDWNRDKWLREAQDFVNPIIEDLWNPDRMRGAETPPDRPVGQGIPDDAGVTDATPVPVPARPVQAPYRTEAPEAGKVFFDGPEGSMVCSATVVADPANPGKSNLVWTAGHCVHAGKDGGWYRNIAFVPSYNDSARPGAELESAPQDEVAPRGVWWGDWAKTSEQWIGEGSKNGGRGAPYDYAVIHVTPEKGGTGRSLEETVGSALPVDFDALSAQEMDAVTATGYPAGAPFDGERMFQCADDPGRLSVREDQPTMYRVGCTMTGGSSGGGWVAAGRDGRPALVSNTSIGPVPAGWLAGPRLGSEAKAVFDSVSEKFAGR
ncbi:trypsin-like serine peptidase [Streptomyces clavuligerus]|uniref:Putative secreted protein n=1 Tax=Streptomyces clavuligerus TaxID=1901 RepID=E2QA50_STRCL|nr:hypothetical protein [Streptomyces clavuligerus]ANW17721.1 hypothetical protein BB341_05515 [Streptomyces clavuligerus]AXU12270.1 hypothetical protein D1794_05715 [Streptomyces clavuligerus]EFG09749.1 Putative secreted protein [Streptomyces clavuligerus]MBY6302148.1 hypothetical protein [Streptomyces clavuligerus]QCS05051.1 hypothetical protein CRV15_05135 [Streptomyces clavuligerus]